ncbi:hypothetical protein ZWY2020_017837 [Hordeum vulgare]|nr:hypothetical protein ZWY2020_017837 [Hordeum vulgare]
MSPPTPTPTPVTRGRLDLEALLPICVIRADEFMSSHLYDKLMAETPYSVLVVDHVVNSPRPNPSPSVASTSRTTPVWRASSRCPIWCDPPFPSPLTHVL